MKPYYEDDNATIWHGDCLDVLAEMPDNSVDAIVTDPPYGLGFMGQKWDTYTNETGRAASSNRHRFDHVGGNHNPSNSADASRTRRVEAQRFGEWCSLWTVEALRVLKPGGHLLAFGGTRTWHRLAVAVEDAGFEVRDSIAWLYGSGFPKSLDVSKAIDKAAGAERERVSYLRSENDKGRGIASGAGNYGGGGTTATNPTVATNEAVTPAAQQWQGWGTALKPAFEPIVVARKPLVGTVASNVLAWGCGAINVGACRVGSTGSSAESSGSQARARGCAVHPVRDLRRDGQEAQVDRGSAEVAEHMQSAMHGQADERPTESELVRGFVDSGAGRIQVRPDEQPVGRGQGALAEAHAAGSSGAPASDGPEGRSPTTRLGDGASHQRGEGGQPAGEPAPHGLGGAQSGTPADRAGVDGTSGRERPTPGCTCGTNGVAPAGRWPANVLLDGDAAAELDEQRGALDSGGASRYFPVFRRTVCPDCYADRCCGRCDCCRDWADDFPTFRYQAKAPTRERVKVADVAHPTVKPLALMRWLVRLVTPPGGVVVDPFAGSGTTVEAAILEGFQVIGIEREADYLPLIEARIARNRITAEGLPAVDDALALFDIEEPA